MNRDEKNQQTRQKIIDSALSEFGEKSYAEASLNTVCAAGNISKGIIYHYFKDKDELYLYCVKECFDALTEYLRGAVTVENVPIETSLERYFDARIVFFGRHPLYLGVFYSAIVNPPAHLSAAIETIKADFDALNTATLTTYLGMVKLRSDVTMAEIIEVFREYQDFINTRFQMRTLGADTLQDREKRCRRFIQILLYGLIERGEDV